MEDGDVVRLRSHHFHELGVQVRALGGGPKSDLSLVDESDVDEALLVSGGAGGLEQGRQGGGLVGEAELGDLLHVVVVEDDVGGQDLLDKVQRLAGETRKSGVVDGEDGDGLAAVDLVVEVGLG